MEPLTTEHGRTVFVSRENPERGSKGPFFIVFQDNESQDRFGFYCSNCKTTDTAMDSMGRIACNECGNMRKAEEWDAAHE